jgi:CBS domain containing-hemolysin-like protein
MHLVLNDAIDSGMDEYLKLLIETSLATIIILLLAEYIPKAIFSAHADQMMRMFGLPAYLFFIILYLPVSLMIGITNFILKYILRLKLADGKPVFGRIELDKFIREKIYEQKQEEETEVEPELEILKNALDFSNRKAREFMVPRTEIASVDASCQMPDLKEKFVETGFSKIVVYNENIDTITGYVHAFELFRHPKNIKDVLRPVLFIPESMTADDILKSFTREQRNMAVVVDEFGGTAGMITLEDVVEELFGEIEDEHDTDDFVERKVSDTEYIFSARLELDYLNDEYDLGLPESGNFTTLGGLIFEEHESIPEKGEVIRMDKFEFTIRKVSNNRIEEVTLRVLG